MDTLMKAVVLRDDNLIVQNVEKPQKAGADHLIVKMSAAAINSGDKFFLKYPTPPGYDKKPL
jgi:NADPH:quinone reductase-like Zn-dependent oxidoreductase